MAGERHNRAFWRELSAAVDRGDSIASTVQRYGVRGRVTKRRPATLLPVVVRAEAMRETAWPSELDRVELRPGYGKCADAGVEDRLRRVG